MTADFSDYGKKKKVRTLSLFLTFRSQGSRVDLSMAFHGHRWISRISQHSLFEQLFFSIRNVTFNSDVLI